MTSTELALNRTLTDILEDELYNIREEHHIGHSKSKNVLELSLPLPFDEYMTGNDENIVSSEYNWARPSISPGSSEVTDSNSQRHHQHAHIPDRSIFNKYADPSLTTTSRRRSVTESDLKSNGRGSLSNSGTPIQKTVNLNSVMKVANPFHLAREQLPFDVKVTGDVLDGSDSAYSTQPYDDNANHDASYDPKTYWPLQDNNVALSNEDAKMIFDHEFAAEDDDDLSEDEEDEREYTRDYKKIPLGYAGELASNKLDMEDKVFSSCNFVDSNMAGTSLNEDESVLDITSDFDNMIDEDDLYEPSSRNGRKESVVSDATSRDGSNEGKLQSISPAFTMVKSQSGKAGARQKSSPNLVNSSPSVSSRRGGLTNKKNTHSPYPQDHTVSETSNGTEIFTCMIINSITKQPCSAQFSRSYDLTRHQNTIHAKKKAVFRCFECISLLGQEGYQKTFSRLDALTRHIKSKHEDLSLERRQEVTRYARENIGYVVG
ncbi:hypothetical protein HG536_0G02740 [Torulaspora globosa]|uniref:C2H2-type domain-containing protein n=1 Tax=Torulaspora globosa TaxID=48254 RepID=A0A7G3ZLM7_9SACH|nr:uncharacterized protein HG536_0G02740 [Torulaspora globosa]QLL34413.1 hypothetical protein HG536_0G02740 [Torulaspora globosa]